jgi:hypothetical protein
LILGTPDYSTVGWRAIEPIYSALTPGGYQGENVTHYTLEQLREILSRYGMAIEETAYIAGSELILRCRKARVDDRARTEVPAVASTAA